MSKFSLAGKFAVVTGAGRGIGKAVALALARAGAGVAVVARTVDEIERCASEIREQDGTAVAIPCDVSDGQQVERMIARAANGLGRIDILVNNAGGGCPAVPFLEMKEEWWDEHISKNLKSAFLCTRAGASLMSKQGGGSIVNMSSVMGIGPHPGRAPYAAAKSGLIGLTSTLAVELAPHGIRVNAIAPGFIETERMWKQFPNYETTLRKARLAKVPLGRMGIPQDVANVTVFLASEAASYITGQVIRVDGGLVTTVFYNPEEGRSAWW